MTTVQRASSGDRDPARSQIRQSELPSCECGEQFVLVEEGWLYCARGHYERTPESRAEMERIARALASGEEGR